MKRRTIHTPRDVDPIGASRRRRWPLRLAGIAVVLVGIVLLGRWAIRDWERSGSAVGSGHRGTARGKNVLLITLDTLRSDHLGCYGYDLIETPVIDRLAHEGIRFDRAVTAVPMTLPAHCTIMTGLYPPEHGVRDNGTFRLLEDHTTLAEVLKREGYTTAAFIGAFVLDARYGLDQGFDHYDDDFTLRHRPRTPTLPHSPERPANVVVGAALDWLGAHHSAGHKPFFMWVHLFDPHQPYDPPEPYRTRYADRPYDGEIAFVDEQLGRLMAGIERLGLTDTTLTVVVGDHGEGLGEHGEATHRQLIYGSTMRIPLIVHGSGSPPPGTVIADAVAGTVDVMPTVLELLGLELPSGCPGCNILSGDLDSNRALYLETLSAQLNDGWAPLFGLRRVADKYIDAPAPEYFDLAADPGELNNLWTEQHETAAELAEMLARIQSGFPPPEASASVTPMPEELRKLGALGYVASGAPHDGSEQLDPKVMIHTFNQRIEAVNLMQEGRTDEAIRRLEALLAESASSAELWSLLGSAQQRAGLLDEAIRSTQKAVDLTPTNPQFLCQLAAQHYLRGDAESAEAALEEALRLEPGNGQVWLIRARRAMAEGRDDNALAYSQKAIGMDPVRSTGEGLAIRGLIHERRGEVEQAEAAFNAAIEHDPYQGTALVGRARIAMRRGERQRAMTDLGQLIDGQPEYAEGGRLLGQLFFEEGDPRTAAAIFGELVRRDPRDGAAHFELSRVLASQNQLDAAMQHLQEAARLGAADFDRVRSDPSFQALRDDPRVSALEQSR